MVKELTYGEELFNQLDYVSGQIGRMKKLIIVQKLIIKSYQKDIPDQKLLNELLERMEELSYVEKA